VRRIVLIVVMLAAAGSYARAQVTEGLLADSLYTGGTADTLHARPGTPAVGTWAPLPNRLPFVEAFEVQGTTLRELARALTAHYGIPIIVADEADRAVSARFGAGPLADALAALAMQEGLALEERDGAFRLSTYEPQPPVRAAAELPPGVTVRDGLVSVNVTDAPVAEVLGQLAQQADVSLVLQPGTDALLTARWEGLPLDDALHVLLTGTNLTYRRDGPTVVVADRQLPGMLTTRLLPLRHVPAGGLVEQMPAALRQYATHQLVQELNAIVVTAPADVVAATEAFLREIDRPAEQILLEVLVVEFETTGLRRLGVTFLGGLLPADQNLRPPGAEAGWHEYLFGGGADQRGGLDVIGDGEAANRFLNFWRDLLGIRSIGRLPADFYFRLQALERSGNAQVRSRPHIATLNGHTANITVGTSQYYILRSASPYGGGVFGDGEVERFEYVQADVRLDITPWVTGDGGVTAVIRPSFTTPVGTFDPRIPPALQRWSVDTSVRLQDGETFMIGGLIQERERVSENRIPLLGSLPLIGPLFRNSERERSTSELVIFMTPHVLREGERPVGTERLYERLAPRERPLENEGRVW
jgi:type IV pilus assembly protein PilQ